MRPKSASAHNNNNNAVNAGNTAELELTLLNKPAEQMLNGSLPNNGNGLNGKSTRLPLKPQESQEELLAAGLAASLKLTDGVNDGNNIAAINGADGGDNNSLHNMNNNKSLSASEAAIQERMETATADVIIAEYPAECFPEHMYTYCPWCLDETTFWARWKELRRKCYKCVENKYFETLVITLILISSMCLVSLDYYFPSFL